MTCFYMAWSFLFLLKVVLVTYAWLAGANATLSFARKAVMCWKEILALVLVAILSLAPFGYAFIPKASEVGVRTFDDAMRYTVPLWEVIQVGQQNLLFGPVTQTIVQRLSPGYVPASEYYNTGINFALLFLFLLGVRGISKRANSNDADHVMLAIAIATLITWVATLRIGNASLWFFVFHLLPGAKALRVVSIYQMFLIGPVLLIVARYLAAQRLSAGISTLLAGLLLLGELNQDYINLDRSAEVGRISGVAVPPGTCKAFYVSGWVGQGASGDVIENLYAHNVTAMLLGQTLGLPTINGFASFNPPDWNFAKPNAEDYEARVAAYAERHNIRPLCRLDLNAKSWSIN
jgi:hypothetical protein